MKSPKTLLIALLTLTTLGGAALAWRQYAELVELRALVMNRDERADLQKRVWDLEKANRELQDRLAATPNPAGDLDGTVAQVGEERPSDRGGRGGRWDGRGRGGPPQFTALRELMNKPEVQAMVATQQKAAIEARYAALFRSMNLSPDQTEQLKTLLAERQSSRQDVFEAARSQGIDPRENPEAYQKLLADSRSQVDNAIKGVIGDSGMAQLQSYEQTMPQRNLVNELQQRLSYSNTPLNSTQADQLVQILAENAPPRPTSQGATANGQPGTETGRGGDFGGRGAEFGMMGAMFGGRGGPDGGMIGAVMDGGRGMAAAPITPAAVNQAQAILSQPQVSALEQLQKQQQTQQQLAQMVHDTLVAAQPPTGTSATGANAGTAGDAAGTAPAPSRRGRGGR